MEIETFYFQLFQARMHRRNAAEQALRAWKNHFLVGLSSVDGIFTINLWDQLLYQVEITLNIM